MKLIRIYLAAVATVYGAVLVIVAAGHISGFMKYAAWEKEAAASALSLDARSINRGASLKKRMAGLQPRGPYIVIDTAGNRLFLMMGGRAVMEAVVSTGSGDVLEEPGGKKRTWIFDTPRGEYAVKSKVKNPYWVKPDWAFIEEGEPIPKKLDDRMEEGVLGDYALGFGDGYFIHGTLYTRLLGRNVTHGCVRVGDKDLEAIFKAVSIGTKIYIY